MKRPDQDIFKLSQNLSCCIWSPFKYLSQQQYNFTCIVMMPELRIIAMYIQHLSKILSFFEKLPLLRC